MAQLDVLLHPHPALRAHAAPVATVDAGIRRLIDDLLETMYAARGIGLAATQVGEAKRVIVLDVSPAHDEPLALINPEIVEAHGSATFEEGCLSVPGVNESVTRAAAIRVTGQDRDGKEVSLEADDILAACLQHEIEHLDGRLFIDHLSRLKQSRIRKRAARRRREAVA